MNSTNGKRFQRPAFQRQLERQPLLQPTRQRRNIEAGLSELEGHTGARGFTGSRADQHQQAVSGKLLNFLVENVQRDPNSSRNGVRVRVEFHPLPQVCYLNRLAGFQTGMQLHGLYATAAQTAVIDIRIGSGEEGRVATKNTKRHEDRSRPYSLLWLLVSFVAIPSSWLSACSITPKPTAES